MQSARLRSFGDALKPQSFQNFERDMFVLQHMQEVYMSAHDCQSQDMHKYIRLQLNMTCAMPSRIKIDLLIVKRPVAAPSPPSHRAEGFTEVQGLAVPETANCLFTGGGVGNVGCGVDSLVPAVARALVTCAVRSIYNHIAELVVGVALYHARQSALVIRVNHYVTPLDEPPPEDHTAVDRKTLHFKMGFSLFALNSSKVGPVISSLK